MLGSKCDLKMHVRNVGVPSTYKSGAQKPHFRRIHNLKANLTAYIFGTKHDINNLSSALEITRVFYITSKRHELWSTNGLKLDQSFYTPSVNFAFYFVARLRRRRSANGTQPNFAQRWTVHIALTVCRRKVRVVFPQKLGA